MRSEDRLAIDNREKPFSDFKTQNTAQLLNSLNEVNVSRAFDSDKLYFVAQLKRILDKKG